MTNEIDAAIEDLNSRAESICQDISAGTGRAEYSGVKTHIILALAYMHAVRRLHEGLRSRSPDSVAAAKDAANRVAFKGDNAADWIISMEPLDRVEIVKPVANERYVALSSLMVTARPLWALFHDDMAMRWHELDRLFGKKGEPA